MNAKKAKALRRAVNEFIEELVEIDSKVVPRQFIVGQKGSNFVGILNYQGNTIPYNKPWQVLKNHPLSFRGIYQGAKQGA